MVFVSFKNQSINGNYQSIVVSMATLKSTNKIQEQVKKWKVVITLNFKSCHNRKFADFALNVF